MSKLKAVYAGSFDPVTNGHLDVIERAAKMFDLYVAIGVNSDKKPMFEVKERLDMIKLAIADQGIDAHVTHFSGLLVSYCASIKAKVIVRGARAVTDFVDELGLFHVNLDQNQSIDMVLFPTKPRHSFISSSRVKELAKHKGDISTYVPESVAFALREYYK